jgi:hypothetical protein
MKNVSKLLAAVALCATAALPIPTPSRAAATDASSGAVEPGAVPPPAAAQQITVNGNGIFVDGKKLIEAFTDRCSTDVVIKAPYPDPDEPPAEPPEPSDNPSNLPLDDGDIVLARTEEMCRSVTQSPSNESLGGYDGVCQRGNETSHWTKPISYMSVFDNKGGTRRFRWFCGKARERSRCKKGTTHVMFRLKAERKFETWCLKAS